MLFFIFEFIWVHNGAERWVRCRFSWLASKVVSSLKFLYFHIIIVIIISIIIITIILYLEYLDFSLFSLKARKKHLINTKLCFWGINRIPFPHAFEKRYCVPFLSPLGHRKISATSVWTGSAHVRAGHCSLIGAKLKGNPIQVLIVLVTPPLPHQGCLTTALVLCPYVDSFWRADITEGTS